MVVDTTQYLAVPFLRPEEIYFVLFDRTTDGVAVIVAAQLLLVAAWLPRTLAKEEVLRIEQVVSAEVVDVAMELVTSALGYDVDLRPRCAAIFGSVTVALDFEFLDAINGRVGKNGALRADIIVPRAVHCPLVADRRRTTEGNIHAGEQAFIPIVKTFAHRRARNQRGQLHEAPAVHWEFAHLFAQHNVPNIASRRIDGDGGSFYSDGFRGGAHLHS